MRSRDWEPVLWSRWGRDWARRASGESIARLCTRDLRGGDVLLLHDADHYSVPGSWRNTAAALPLILDEVERRDLTIVPLDGGLPDPAGAVASRL